MPIDFLPYSCELRVVPVSSAAVNAGIGSATPSTWFAPLLARLVRSPQRALLVTLVAIAVRLLQGTHAAAHRRGAPTGHEHTDSASRCDSEWYAETIGANLGAEVSNRREAGTQPSGGR